MTARARVLIVDDSAVMRSLLRSVVSADARLEVAGTAANGADALEAVARLRPDVMLLDVEMPVLDGLETLRRLQTRGIRLPVIMCSAVTQRGARVTIEALAGGASDYVAKPAQQASREQALARLRAELVPKIHALTSKQRAEARTASLLPRAPQCALAETPAIVAIGVSTGGPAALERVLPGLPSSFPLPIVVVQHMPDLFTRLLAERLDRGCRLRVREATEGAPVRAGEVVIARGDWHLELLPAAAGAVVQHLTKAPPENHCRPSADVLFRSCRALHGARVLAVVLTGMGSDGLAGCRALREAGATVLAQDEATSAVWGMPGAVAQAGLAHRIVPLGEMAAEILRLAGTKSSGAERLREAVV
jgi:two-component system chemotaxis response regulator CheB